MSKTLKCYVVVVDEHGWPGLACEWVHARRPGHARYLVAKMGTWDMPTYWEWRDLKVRRCPGMDGLEITPLNLLRTGAMGWIECPRCDRALHLGLKGWEVLGPDYVYHPADVIPYVDQHGDVWCSQECHDEAPARWRTAA